MPEPVAPLPPPNGAPAAADVTMYDPATGAPVSVPADQAAAAYRSGAATFKRDQMVPVQENGELVLKSGEQLGQDLGTARGYATELGGAGQYGQQEERKEYGGLGQGAAAFAEGAARAATFGISDTLFSDEAQERMRKRQEHRSLLSGAGELAGAVLPALVSDGASLGASGAKLGLGAAREASVFGTAARVASAPVRAVSGLGRLAGGGVARGLGALGVDATGTLARAGISAAGQGAEMAFYGAGQELSRQALAGEELDAEKLVAAGGMSALLGAGIGGGLSLGGSAAAYAGRKAVEAGSKAVDGSIGLLGRLSGVGEAKAGAQAAELGEHLASTVPTRAEVLDSFSRDQTIKATGASEKQVQKLREMGPDIETEVNRQFHEDLARAAGKKDAGMMTRNELAEAAEKNKHLYGRDIDESLADIEAKMTGVRPDAKRAMDNALGHVFEPLKAEGPLFAEHASKLERQIEDIADTLHGKDFLEFRESRTKISKLIEEYHGSPVMKDALKQVRGIFEDELERSALEAATKGGNAELAARFVTSKKQYRAALWLADSLEKGATREAKNATFGLKEMLGGNAGGGVGAKVGGALGSIAGPLGAAAGGTVGGLLGQAAGAYASHQARLYGNQVAASVARKAISSDLLTAITSTVDKRIAGGLGDFFGKGLSTAKTLPKRLLAPAVAQADASATRSKGTLEKRFLAARQETANHLAQSAAKRNAAVTEALHEVSPTLAKAVSKQVDAGHQYLQKVAPKPPPQAHLLSPQLDRPAVPPSKMAEYLDVKRAVESPASVIDDLQHGTATAAQMAAIREVYPRMFEQIQMGVAQHLSEIKKSLPYAKELQLAILTGVPVEQSMTPAFVQAMQKQYAPPPKPQMPGAPPAGDSAPKRPMTLASAYASPTDTPGETIQ